MKINIFIIFSILFLFSCESPLKIDSQEEVITSFESYDVRNYVSDYKSSLIHYFPFDDAQVIDHGLKSASIEVTGNPNLSADLMGQAINFNGSADGQDDYFQLSLADENKYSFSFWIHSSSVRENATHYLFYSSRFLLHDRGSNRVQLEVNGDSGRTRFKNDAVDAYNSDEWNHIVITVDLTNSFDGDSTGDCKMYINGNEVTVFVEAEATGSPQPNDIAIFGNSLALTRPFVGKYDEIAIFNRALTQTEVENIYNAQK